MLSPEDLRLSMLEHVHESCKSSFDMQSSLFSTLDSKAQNVITGCGIILSATLVFLKADNTDQLKAMLATSLILILLFVLLLVVFAMVLSIVSLSVREIPFPPNPAAVQKTNFDVLDARGKKLSALDNETVLRMEINSWLTINQKLATINKDKSEKLANAQFMLAIAIGSLGLFLGIRLVGLAL